jgi:hypothetical protein
VNRQESSTRWFPPLLFFVRITIAEKGNSGRKIANNRLVISLLLCNDAHVVSANPVSGIKNRQTISKSWEEKMKNICRTIIGIFVIAACNFAVHAITNTMIAVSGTNVVLSWPSHGYESYLIQYRQTLDVTDSWSQLVNAYPANSTNLTTFTIYGVASPPANGGGNTSGSSTGGPPNPDMANGSMMIGTSGPLVVPVGGSGNGVPLVLYPPGFDLSGFSIFDPLTGASVSGAGYSVRPSFGGASPLDAPSGDPPPAPTTGFFRVFHIPNWLADISNYTFDGPTFIPVDYAAPDAPTNYIDASQVLINGQPFDDVVFMPYDNGGTTYWGMGIYFDLLPNGTNTIQLLTTVRQSDALNDQTPYMVFSNAPQAIVIGNSVAYTNWSQLILSNSYTFDAQSSTPNVNWEIDIYDVYNNFVNSQTGYSADGNISWTWNLKDSTGASRQDDNDPFFYPYISVTSASGDPGGWTPPIAEQFPNSGSWLFAYLDNNYDDGTSNYPGADYYYTNGIHTMEGGPIEWNVGSYGYPIKYGRVYSQTNRDASWQTLEETYLQFWPIRNFYYFGHGSASAIGGDINTLDSSNNITGSTNLPGSHAYLTSQWVHDNITFNQQIGPMPYRFVFLDGCNTASGNWPWAWNVPAQVVGVDYYRSSSNKTGARPNAFAGWDVEIGGNKDWGKIQGFWAFRTDWMGDWANNPRTESLANAFSIAFTVSDWVQPDHYHHLKNYGYTSMLFLQYDHAGDWP